MKLITEAAVPSPGQSKTPGRDENQPAALVSTRRSFGDIVRARRSALDFRGGCALISFSQLATVLSTAKNASSPILL
jgi:hypothetical protein